MYITECNIITINVNNNCNKKIYIISYEEIVSKIINENRWITILTNIVYLLTR